MKIYSILFLLLFYELFCSNVVTGEVNGKVLVIDNSIYSRCFVTNTSEYDIYNHDIVAYKGYFSYFNESQKPLIADITLNSPFRRGDVVKVKVGGSRGLKDVTAIIKDYSGNKIDVGNGFHVGGYWFIVLGIPSYIKRGGYILNVKGSDGIRRFFYSRKIDIEGKVFAFEEIRLNASLTSLRRRNDIKVREETRKLVRIIQSFERNAIFTDGSCVMPVKGKITAGYGDRRRYLYSDGEVQNAIHNGIDIAVPVGTKIHACATGRVVMAEKRIITGNSVIIEHLPGIYSIYYHLDSIIVHKGDMVKKGEVIGLSGMSGLATGPHLHWEIRVSGIAVNPVYFLEEGVIDKNIFMGSIKT